MFLMSFFRFTSVILPLDVDSFKKSSLIIFLWGKRLVWKSMGFYLVYSSLYSGSHFVIFSCFKASDVPSILDLDIFIEINASRKDSQNKILRKCDRGPHEGTVLCGGGRFRPAVIGL